MPWDRAQPGDWLDSWLEDLLQASKPITRLQAIVFALAFTALLAGLDLFLGPSVQFTIMYSFGVIAVGWSGSRSDALWMALLATLVWVLVEFLQPTMAVPTWPFFFIFVLRLTAMGIIALATSKARSATETFERLAQEDPLTGLLNRRAFCEQCDAELGRARRYPEPLSAVYIDIDDFKIVNDHFGHDEGDTLLCDLARVLGETLRPSDIAARVGGDEFACMLPSTGQIGATATGERLLERMSAVARRHDSGVSVGVVTFSDIPPTAEVVLAEADHVMYSAKRSGKGRLSAEFVGPTAGSAVPTAE